jgi:O-antigen ligase/cytochrome c-type biogenesis protein CcmH/NrfG
VKRALQSWAERLIEILWLGAAVATPLVFNPWGYNSFELPKTALLRALVLLMGLLALAWGVERRAGGAQPESSGRALPLLWPVLAWGLVQVLAVVVSVRWQASLWGSYERQQGLLTLASYVLFFLLTATFLRRRAQAERLWLALTWGSLPVVVYGLLQVAGLDPLQWATDAASPVLSTVGRANFLGSYLVLVVPLTAGRLVLANRRWPLLLLLVAQAFCLLLTQARGALVGLGAAAVTFGLLWAAVTRRRRLGVATLVAAALAGGLVVLLNLPQGPLAALADLPVLERLASLSRTDAGSTAARLTIWRTTWPLVLQRPWMGYGPETMRVEFLRVFPPQLVYYQGRQVVVDRAHNLWLDLTMSSGLAGVVTFGWLLVAFGRSIWRGLQTKPDRWHQAMWIALAAVGVGHLIDLQFSFELTSSAVIWWLTLALGSVVERGWIGQEPEATASAGRGSPLILLPPALAVLALIYLVCLRPLLADTAHGQGWREASRVGERVDAAARAVRLWSLEPEYRLGYARALLQAGDLTAAEGQLLAADSLSPDDPRVSAAYGELYTAWGSIDPARLVQAEEAYRRAVDLAPNVAAGHTYLGLALVRQGRLEEGLASLERAVDLDATDGAAYGYLADLYGVLGREEDAAWARSEAVRWGEGTE